MNKKIITVIAISGFLMMSCSGDTENTSANDLPEAEMEIIDKNLPGPHELMFDKGEKWIVDEGMMVAIDSIDYTIGEFNGTVLEDYMGFSKEMSHHLGHLTSSCTMKGQSHDELHKWLLPFIKKNKSIKKDSTLVSAEQKVMDLKEELLIFNTYFE